MRYLLFLALLCWGFSSCQQRLYFPDRANTPMFSRGQEAKITVSGKPQNNYSDSAHGSGGANSLGIDIAAAPVNHFGIIASYRDVNRRRIGEDLSTIVNAYGGLFTGHRWEGAAGYFSTFQKMGRYEVYAGYGDGELSRRGYYTPERDFDTHYHRYFLQAAAGAGNHIFAASGGLRLAYQRYYHFSSPTTPDLRFHVLDLNGPAQDVEAATFGFIEPFVNGEVGWKYIKFNMQFGSSAQISGSKIAGNTPFYFSFGATFQFNPDYLQKSARSNTQNAEPGKRKHGPKRPFTDRY